MQAHKLQMLWQLLLPIKITTYSVEMTLAPTRPNHTETVMECKRLPLLIFGRRVGPRRLLLNLRTSGSVNRGSHTQHPNLWATTPHALIPFIIRAGDVQTA